MEIHTHRDSLVREEGLRKREGGARTGRGWSYILTEITRPAWRARVREQGLRERADGATTGRE